MFNGKSLAAVLSILMTLVLVLTGCSSSDSPKDSLQKAMEKSADIHSYELSGSLKLADLKLPEEVMQEEGAAGALGFLTNTEISWTGAYQADPMLMELTMKISISGDLAMSFQIPIIMNKEKMWIKIPNIPMLGLPEDMVGKFIELDLKQMAEDQGAEWPGNADVGNMTKLANDVYAIVFKHVDEKTYLSNPKPEDAGVPKDKAKSVVQLHMTKDQVEPFVNTLVKDIAPEVIDLLAKNEQYRNMLQLKPEDLDEAKKQLSETGDQDIKDAMAEFDKSVKELDVTANIGIDKDGYASYDDLTVKANIEDNGQSGSGTLKIVTEMSNINGDVKFENGEPKADQILSEDQLNQALGGFFGGAGDFSGLTDESLDAGSGM
ncbi:hypothetical protein [Cohnella zeiphila]|uniref:Uncharacterized protein n=1 Tax=Cohnella zeiphila TaxID=2761120 RepID=A0A7X0SQ20_9BACL|nr:hypothetical protein [Cohnella zeiphila]MBB6733996.1 hypothetical protein [Cohnella zeiphila]